MKKNHLFPLLLLWGITSCSTVKQLHQDKTEVNTEISSLEKTFTESQIVTVAKVTEKKDSILVLPGSELSVSAKFQDLLGGDTIYAAGEDLSLKTFYDSLTKTIKTQAVLKSKSIPFQFQKVTETRQVAIGTVTTSKEEQQKQMLRTENIDKKVQRHSFPAWLIILLIILFIGVIGFLVMKFRKYL
jgi:hypothetical protein